MAESPILVSVLARALALPWLSSWRRVLGPGTGNGQGVAAESRDPLGLLLLPLFPVILNEVKGPSVTLPLAGRGGGQGWGGISRQADLQEPGRQPSPAAMSTLEIVFASGQNEF
jgi:hypothetical protein